jgi:hypothetical protein
MCIGNFLVSWYAALEAAGEQHLGLENVAGGRRDLAEPPKAVAPKRPEGDSAAPPGRSSSPTAVAAPGVATQPPRPDPIEQRVKRASCPSRRRRSGWWPEPAAAADRCNPQLETGIAETSVSRGASVKNALSRREALSNVVASCGYRPHPEAPTRRAGARCVSGHWHRQQLGRRVRKAMVASTRAR